MFQLTPTVDVVEVIFTTLAVVAFYLHRAGAVEARADLDALHETGRNSALLLVAKQNLLQDNVMAGVQLLFAVTGFMAMFLAPPRLESTRIVAYILFLTAQGALVYLSYSNRVLRQKLTG